MINFNVVYRRVLFINQPEGRAKMWRKIIEWLLEGTGITINGKQPHDLQVINERFFRRVALGGSLALGESFMDGDWECRSLDDFFHHLLLAEVDQKARLAWPTLLETAKHLAVNLQSIARAHIIGERHYDLGNGLFEAMLGPTMTYSCAWWQWGANDLDQAQTKKFRMICEKLRLEDGDRLLEIGCGWGGLAEFAAREYGAAVVGLTVSKEQAEFARQRCAGLNVEIRIMDYRGYVNLNPVPFNKIVSVGMFEHVGAKNYHVFMETVNRLLKDNGLFLLHTIGRLETKMGMDPWYSKYIFPNSVLPSIQQIAKAVEGIFVIEDLHNFGTDYDQTLMAWYRNFEQAWPNLRGECYDDRFYRMWVYYLLSCAGSFRARKNQLWQVVLAKNPTSSYPSIR